MQNIILLIICILNCVLFISSLYMCVFKPHTEEIENEGVEGFIYYITLSSIKDINCDITDYYDYKEYIKIMIYIKVIQEIELDNEFKYLLDNKYLVFNEIERIFDEDEELNQQIETKYNQSRQSNIDIEEFDDVADNIIKKTDITNDLINFMK